MDNTSVSPLPNKYLGALVRNGYILSEHPDVSESTIFKRYLDAAKNGDKIAQRVLNMVRVSEHDLRMIAKELNCYASLSVTGKRLSLAPKGVYINRIVPAAEAGDYLAQRLVAYITLRKMTDPEFTFSE